MAVLEACVSNDCKYALVDVSGITEPHMATEKLIFAHNVAETVSDFQKIQSAIPRIAMFGTNPFITTYKPGSDYFQTRNIPIRTFDDQSSAETWLFAENVQ